MHGRDLLVDCLIWHSGEGSRVLIHHDNLLPRSSSLKPLGQSYIAGLTRVGDLLEADGISCDRSKVQQMFAPDEAQEILQIPVGGPGVQDYQAWNYKWYLFGLLGLPSTHEPEAGEIRTAGVFILGGGSQVLAEPLGYDRTGQS